MNRIVLDASAILAVLNREPGHEKLTAELLVGAVGSTVNLAEVQTKLVSRGWTSDEAWKMPPALFAKPCHSPRNMPELPAVWLFRRSTSASPWVTARCLAVGMATSVPPSTRLKKAWTKLKLGVRIHAIR